MQKYLLVVDMQKDFIDGALGSAEAAATVDRAGGCIRDAIAEGRTLLFTQDTHGEGYLATSEGRHLPVPHCLRGTEGWQLHETLARYAAETIEKPSFGSPELIQRLQKAANGDGSNLDIALCGLCTDICVVTNALMIRGHFPEATLRVYADSCAGTSRERHQAALEVLAACHVAIV